MDISEDELRDLGEMFGCAVTFGRDDELGERRVVLGESGHVWFTYDAARQLVAAYRSGRIQRDA
jgi:hypothetical protein